MNRPKVALVLGGGGSRGIAHVGVLQILEAEGIPIDFIVGTSMGSIVGILYALGISPDHIAERMIENITGSPLLNINMFSARGRQKNVRSQLESTLGDKTFADLKIPAVVMCVDMVSGQEVMLREGPLMTAVLASSAVPGVFPPVPYQGMQLADGGVIDSLATHVAYAHCPDYRIIAVDVYPELEQDNPWIEPLTGIVGIEIPFVALNTNLEKIPSTMSSIWRSVRVMTWHLHQRRLESHPPHVLLRPAVDDYGSLDFKDVKGPMIAGANAALENLNLIKSVVGRSESA